MCLPKLIQRRVLLGLLLVLLGGISKSSAQDVADSDKPIPPTTYGTDGPRTSPFDPDEENDHRFVVDDAPGLDTGCSFRSDGPLVFDIEVTRYVGPTNANGTLRDAGSLVAGGLLSSTAELSLPGFDVDSRADVVDTNPEVDRVLFNGIPVGTLDGLDDAWVLNAFEIPIELVKFPQRGSFGTEPPPARNTISIEIDVANADESWCTAVDWAALEFKAISPIILVHGNNSDAGFFDRQGFSSALEAENFPFDGCGGCPNPINLPTTTVAANGASLLNLIPGIVKTFGTDSYHLVVHSKGGLDSRSFLAAQGSTDPQAISYTSLSTPHNGSVLADLAIQRLTEVRRFYGVEFVGFPTGTELLTTLAVLTGVGAGTPNLTTGFTAGFNASNLPSLPTGTAFNATAGDMDRNRNGRVDITPDEYVELRDENRKLQGIHLFSEERSRAAVDIPYQVLRSATEVRVTHRREPGFLGFGTRTVAVFAGVPTPSPTGNDALVAIPSGLGNSSIGPRLSNTQSFTGGAGRNHSSIADDGVGRVVIPWIIQAERGRGDLQ